MSNKKNKNSEVPVVDIGNIVDSYLGEDSNIHTSIMESKMNEASSKNIPKIEGTINECNNSCLQNSDIHSDSEKYEEDLQINFDENSFMEGIKDISYLSSQIAALCTLGIDPNEALKYFASMEDLKTSVKIAEIQKEMAIECAKYGTSSDL